MTDWLTTAEAAARLGVRPQTLYAYVSRGALHSRREPGRRTSLFPADEVARLSARARPGSRGGGLEVVVDTELTLLDPGGRLFYRGWDVAQAACQASFEQVAEWLWLGSLPLGPVWEAHPEALAVGRAAQAALPPDSPPVDRVRVVAAALGATDPLRHDRRPEAVVATARALIAALVDCLPVLDHAAGGDDQAGGPVGPREPGVAPPPLTLGGVAHRRSLASRLWPTLSGQRPSPTQLRALNAAMVLLADHELAASTLAARVAASVWADPYLVVLTGLGVMGGPLHGGASQAVGSLLAEVAAGTNAAQAVGARLAQGQPIPGAGHLVYVGPDPRATILLDLVEQACLEGHRPQWEAVAAVRDVMAQHSGPAPNVDFALAALAHTSAMTAGAETIFAVARCAGWLAHALEEYRHRLRFRPRAVYTGPAPGSAPPPGSAPRPGPPQP